MGLIQEAKVQLAAEVGSGRPKKWTELWPQTPNLTKDSDARAMAKDLLIVSAATTAVPSPSQKHSTITPLDSQISER